MLEIGANGIKKNCFSFLQKKTFLCLIKCFIFEERRGNEKIGNRNSGKILSSCHFTYFHFFLSLYLSLSQIYKIQNVFLKGKPPHFSCCFLFTKKTARDVNEMIFQKKEVYDDDEKKYAYRRKRKKV